MQTARQRPVAIGQIRLLALLARAESWYGPAALVVLFAYPNPLVPVALLAIALGLLARLSSRGEVRGATRASAGPLDVAFGLFILGGLLGLLVAHHREAGLLRFSGLLAAVALFYLVLPRLAGERDVRRWAGLVLAAVGVGALVVLALLRGQLPESTVARALEPALRLFGLFPGVSGDTLEVNARFAVHQYGLAHLLLVAGAFAAATAALGKGPVSVAAGLAGLALIVPLMLATQARGAILALAVAAAAVASLRSRWAWAGIPVAGALFYALLARGTISRSVEADWLNERLSYWSGTLGLLGDFPLSGSGLGIRTFAEVFAWYGGLPDPYAVSHSHNVYIQAYAEQGLLGLAGLLLLVGLGLGSGLRAARRTVGPARWAVAGAAGALLGSAIYGLTDQVVTTNLNFALLCALLAIVDAAERLSRSADPRPVPSERPPNGRTRRLRTAALVAVAVLAVVGLAPRWSSGLLLNWGSAELMSAALDRTLNGEVRFERLERAERALTAAVRWNGENAAARRNLGWARLLRNDVAGAYAVLAMPYRSEITPFERAQLARLARESGQIELTVSLLKAGGDERRLREVAEQMWGQRRWRDAALAYAALTELSPNDAEYVSNAAWAVLNDGGDAERAMELLQVAVAKNPGAARNLARQLTLRGEPCRSDERRGGGRFECAQFWFGLASRVDPTYDRPEVELGSINYYRGLYEDAARHFGEASRRDPRNPSTYAQLGDTSAKLGRLDEAVWYHERALEVGRDRPAQERSGLHLNLGRAYAAAGRRDEAVGELRQAAELTPGDAVIRDELRGVEGER